MPTSVFDGISAPSAQVVTLGNAYEQLAGPPRQLSSMGELAIADERLLSQKAIYWQCPLGWPTISIVAPRFSQHTEAATRRTLGANGWPKVIAPRRTTSSICTDLLEDSSALACIIENLDQSRAVHLSPYIWTEHVEAVADHLRRYGFRLVENPDLAGLVCRLMSKTQAHRIVLAKAQGDGSVLRPRCWEADSLAELARSIGDAFANGCRRVVVKSDRSAGGAGVFLLDAETVRRSGRFEPRMLTARGYNEPDVAAPFLVEEYVEHRLSPTADGYLDNAGNTYSAGIAIQRLYDGRYYAGFHAHRSMERLPWFHQVRAAQVQVGRVLHSVGYQGFFNLDFVINTAGRAHVVELNPRRSALQDAFSMAALATPHGQAVQSISTADYVECQNPLSIGIPDLNSDGVLVVAATDGGFASSYRWTSLCVLGYGGESEEGLAKAVGLLTGIPSDPESITAEIGPVPLVLE